MAHIVSMPKLGFDMAEGTLVRWVILEGEKATKGAVLAEIETDKATVEVEATHDGIVARHLVSAGEVVPVNTPIAVIAAEGEEVDYGTLGIKTIDLPRAQAPRQPVTPEVGLAGKEVSRVIETQVVEGTPYPGGMKASPLARRMVQQMSLDLRKVKGSGPEGRVTKRDVEAFIAGKDKTPLPEPVRKEARPIAPLIPGAGELVPLKRLRVIIGRRMTEVKQQVPHFYVTHEYDVEALVSMRKQLNALLPEEEKVSVNDFIIKGTALALREFPNLNASLQGEQVLHHAAVNIGVAVAVEGGLLTVVCRETDRKPLRQIAAEVRQMAGRAREGKVRPEDIEGSTFSVSNLGMFDVDNFIAIINPPEAAILAVGSARQLPVVREGEIQLGWRMKATLSVDHRVSDGAEAAQFLQALGKYLEEPLRMVIL